MLAWNKCRLLEDQYILWRNLWFGLVEHGSYFAWSWIISAPLASVVWCGHVVLLKFHSVNTCGQGIVRLRTFSCWRILWKLFLYKQDTLSTGHSWSLDLKAVSKAHYQLSHWDRNIQWLAHAHSKSYDSNPGFSALDHSALIYINIFWQVGLFKFFFLFFF